MATAVLSERYLQRTPSNGSLSPYNAPEVQCTSNDDCVEFAYNDVETVTYLNKFGDSHLTIRDGHGNTSSGTITGVCSQGFTISSNVFVPFALQTIYWINYFNEDNDLQTFKFRIGHILQTKAVLLAEHKAVQVRLKELEQLLDNKTYLQRSMNMCTEACISWKEVGHP